MDDLTVIDRFMEAFVRYIDSGFGLLGGDVAFLTTALVGIDVTLAGLFWAMGGEQDVIGRFLRKILYVGAFALILGSFPILSEAIFRSFAGLGLTAGGSTMSTDDLLRPGYVAGTGFDAARPMLEEVAEMIGFVGFFENFLVIAVLMLAWLVVVLAFFVLAIQLFITVIEFKLTALAGFVLVPFALWNRTSFLAERVLGNVVASGIKLMVLAIVVGIGSGFFAEFTGALGPDDTDLAQAMSLVLGSLSLLGLGIFGPGIASGLVAGAPQLGAGAALGTAAAAAGTLAAGGGAALAGARGLAGGSMAALRAGTAMGSAASTAYRLGQETAGSDTVGAGLKGVGGAAAAMARTKFGEAGGLGAAAERGRRAALRAGTAGISASPAAGGEDLGAPQWARRLRAEQTSRHHRHAALQAVREGDRGGAGMSPDISERED